MEEFSEFLPALEAIKSAYGQGAAVGIVVAAFAAVVKAANILVEVWSNSAKIQERLPPKYQWANLSTWKKWGIVVAASALTSLSGGLVLGLGIKAAILATAKALVPIAIGAIFSHSGSKKLGSVFDGAIQKKVEKLVSAEPEKTRPSDMWEPTKFRRIMSPAIPIDWSKYPKSKKILEAVEEMRAPRK